MQLRYIRSGLIPIMVLLSGSLHLRRVGEMGAGDLEEQGGAVRAVPGDQGVPAPHPGAEAPL